MGDKPRFTPSTFVVDKTPEFESLALRAIADEVGGVRVRQHVNPLSSRNQALVPAPRWAELFDDATLPLCLDLGCGSGRFLLALAEKEAGAGAALDAPPRNYLGVEIREPLVGRAALWAERKGLAGRLRYLATNANVNIPPWLASYPGPLQLVSILHPDPHWKRKHRKRRIVQPALARALVERLAPGTGQVFLQSDVMAVAQDMVAVFQAVAGPPLAGAAPDAPPALLTLAEAHFGSGASGDWPPPEARRVNQGDNAQRIAMRRTAREQGRQRKAARLEDGEAAAAAESDSESDSDAFERFEGWAGLPGNGWLRHNPVGVPTERELGTVANGGHCWRALLRRTEALAPPSEAPAPAELTAAAGPAQGEA